MLFTIEQIINYLLTKGSLNEAISQMTADEIHNCNTHSKAFTLEKNDENLKIYEKEIGLADLKRYQQELYRESNGTKGKYWMELSPKWILEPKDLDTNYEIGYWVNYGDDNTYGFFTVEKIIKWLTTDIKLHELGGTKEI